MTNATQRTELLPDAATLTGDPDFIEFAAQALGDAELADGLTPTQLAKLASIGETRQYGNDDLICGEYERTDELYIIETGTVEVWIDPRKVGDAARSARKIATLQAGETCGELALIDGGVRSAQLRAGARGVRLMAFTRARLLALCEADTSVGYRLMSNLATSLALRLRIQDMRLYSSE